MRQALVESGKASLRQSLDTKSAIEQAEKSAAQQSIDMQASIAATARAAEAATQQVKQMAQSANAARRSAEAAETSMAITREMGIAQTRAYLYVSSAQLTITPTTRPYGGETKGYVSQFEFTYTNTGRTPARDIGILACSLDLMSEIEDDAVNVIGKDGIVPLDERCMFSMNSGIVMGVGPGDTVVFDVEFVLPTNILERSAKHTYPATPFLRFVGKIAFRDFVERHWEEPFHMVTDRLPAQILCNEHVRFRRTHTYYDFDKLKPKKPMY